MLNLLLLVIFLILVKLNHLNYLIIKINIQIIKNNCFLYPLKIKFTQMIINKLILINYSNKNNKYLTLLIIIKILLKYKSHIDRLYNYLNHLYNLINCLNHQSNHHYHHINHHYHHINHH